MAKWLRHRFLVSALGGSNPPTPAISSLNEFIIQRYSGVAANLTIFTGNANPELAQKVVKHLSMSLGNASVSQFSDGETSAEIKDHVRGKDVFIIQSTCAPTNDNLMELLVMVDAVRRAASASITAVVPYFG